MHRIAHHRRRRNAGRGRRLSPSTAVAAAPAHGTVARRRPRRPRRRDRLHDRRDQPTFDMETDADYINLPDGNTAYMYGYKLVGTQFQHPSPVLCVKQGDTVTITLTNTLQRDVSMMFPGQTDVTANGAPATPQFSTPGDPSTMTSLTQSAAAERRNGHVHLRRRPSRHVPLRVGHRPRHPGAHGPVRRTDRASDDG